MTTGVVLLAAGAGSRFTGPTSKLLAPLRGGTVLGHAAAAAFASGVGRLYVVVPESRSTLCRVLPDDCDAVVNPWPERGIASSLAWGIEAAKDDGADAVVVGLGDQPFVEPDAWRLVAAATATPMAVATYDGARGNPVRLAAEVWGRLPQDGDEGARVLLRSRPELVTAVPCPGSSADIDTVEDLRTWS